MNEVLHANIFFVIASVATVVFCILTIIILYHVLKAVKTVRRILDRVEAGSEKLAEDISTVRSYVTEGGMISRLFGFFMPSARGRGKRSSRRRTVDVDEAE